MSLVILLESDGLKVVLESTGTDVPWLSADDVSEQLTLASLEGPLGRQEEER